MKNCKKNAKHMAHKWQKMTWTNDRTKKKTESNDKKMTMQTAK
jgi:hypothetical protein